MSKITTIAQILEKRFPKPSKIVINDTHNDGRHFEICVNSSVFEGKSLVEQHQMVYEPLKKLIENNDVHAVQIKTKPLNAEQA